ncbi:MAG: hypothetical protein KDK56_10330 [Simkania sp.]|nr:hypothetical protein [Simkania sp.]
MTKAPKEDLVEIDALEEKVQKQETVKLERIRISAEISGNVAERIKNAVYWTPGMTMAGFIEESLAKAIEELEQEKGEKFPQRERQLVGGRPII